MITVAVPMPAGTPSHRADQHRSASDHELQLPCQSAGKDLRTQGFALGGALDHVQERWEKQLKTLLDACAHISNHVDYTKGAHAGDEYYIYDTVSKISTLDDGFTERTQR